MKRCSMKLLALTLSMMLLPFTLFMPEALAAAAPTTVAGIAGQTITPVTFTVTLPDGYKTSAKELSDKADLAEAFSGTLYGNTVTLQTFGLSVACTAQTETTYTLSISGMPTKFAYNINLNFTLSADYFTTTAPDSAPAPVTWSDVLILKLQSPAPEAGTSSQPTVTGSVGQAITPVQLTLTVPDGYTISNQLQLSAVDGLNSSFSADPTSSSSDTVTLASVGLSIQCTEQSDQTYTLIISGTPTKAASNVVLNFSLSSERFVKPGSVPSRVDWNNCLTLNIEPPVFVTEPIYPDYDEDITYAPVKADTTPYVVTCRTLNVRSTGSTKLARIARIHRGDALDVLSIENGWAKIVWDNDSGYAYVCAKYIAAK